MPQSSPMSWMTLSVFPAVMLSLMSTNNHTSKTLMNKMLFKTTNLMKWTW